MARISQDGLLRLSFKLVVEHWGVMAPFSISCKDPRKVEYYAAKAVSLFDAAGNVSGPSIQVFDSIVFTLGDMLTISGYEENRVDKRSIIWTALSRLRTYKRRQMPDLVRAVGTELRRAARRMGFDQVALYPLNIRYSALGNRRQIKMPGGEIRFLSLRGALKRFKLLEAFRQRESRTWGVSDPPMNEWTFAVVKVPQNRCWSPFEYAESVTEPFRGLVNLSLEYGSFRWLFGLRDSTARVPVSKYVYLFDSKGDYKDFAVSTVDYPERAISLPTSNVDSVWSAAGLLCSVGSPHIRNVLLAALRVYGKAIDEVQPHFVFLYLWQVLELLTFKGEGQKELEVVHRLKGVFLNDELVLDLLSALMRKRNRLVHEGRTNLVGQDDVNELKRFAEELLVFLIAKAPRFLRAEDLVFFYQQITADKNTVRRRRNVVEMILSST